MIHFHSIIPILRIFDIEKANEFYVDYLGFSVEWVHHFEGQTPAYMQITRDGMTLHLTEHHGDCCPGSSVFVMMEDIQTFYLEIKEKNYGYLNPALETTFYETMSFEVTDPFGNRIRFNQRIKRTADDPLLN